MRGLDARARLRHAVDDHREARLQEPEQRLVKQVEDGIRARLGQGVKKVRDVADRGVAVARARGEPQCAGGEFRQRGLGTPFRRSRRNARLHGLQGLPDVHDARTVQGQRLR